MCLFKVKLFDTNIKILLFFFFFFKHLCHSEKLFQNFSWQLLKCLRGTVVAAASQLPTNSPRTDNYYCTVYVTRHVTLHLEIHHSHLEVKKHNQLRLWTADDCESAPSVLKRVRGHVSLRRLEARLGFCLLLLLLVEDDADDVSLVLLHVLHQPLFTCGLKATDTAAEQKHTVFHAGARDRGLTCVWLALGLRLRVRLKPRRVLPLEV